jgi:hypothetical protein
MAEDYTVHNKRKPAYHCPTHGDVPTLFCCQGKHASAEAIRVEQAVAKRKADLAKVGGRR